LFTSPLFVVFIGQLPCPDTCLKNKAGKEFSRAVRNDPFILTLEKENQRGFVKRFTDKFLT